MKVRTPKKIFLVLVLSIILIAFASCAPKDPPSAVPDEIVELVSPEIEEEPEEEIVKIEEETPEPTPTPLPKQDNGYLGSIGYINISGTNVNYTVVVAENNEYYLNKDIDGSRNYRGAIFMDYRNSDPIERRNIILYGHNNKDQTRFSTLHRYNKENFFIENPEIIFDLYGISYKYEIIFSGVFDYREFNHIKTQFSTEQSFLDYYKSGSDHAQFVREGYDPQPGDQMLTLSTCVSHGIKDYNYKRMIVVAKMVEVLGVSDKSEMVDNFGAVEAQVYFEGLPNMQMLSMDSYAENPDIIVEEAPLISPPGE